jgi:hypothetical protein
MIDRAMAMPVHASTSVQSMRPRLWSRGLLRRKPIAALIGGRIGARLNSN